MTDSISALATEDNEGEGVNYLETLVGDGKKYSSVDDLAKAKFHADKHIQTLTEELDKFKTNDSKINEVLEALKKPSVTPDPAANTEVSVDIKALIKQTLTEEQQAALRTANNEASKRKLLEVYGSQEAVKRAISDVISGNPTKQRLVDELAQEDPEQFISMMTKLSPKTEGAGSSAPGAGGHGGNGGHPSLPLTWAEASRVRKEDPALYRSASYQQKIIQAQIAAEKLNVDFFKT